MDHILLCLRHLFLAKSFVLYVFCWVKRSGNATAHKTAKYTLCYSSPLCLSSDNLLANIGLAYKEDVQSC